MRDAYDRSSKWLLEHHGNALLRLGGVRDPLRSWRALAADVVQPRQLPDGLIEAPFEGRADPDLFLVEIATYPERRVEEQLRRDTLLVYLDRERLPEVVTLILQPRGTYRVPDTVGLASRLALAELRLRWRVVEVWTLAAEDLLAADEIGLLPWVPLTQIQGPPESVLRECRRRLDEQAPAGQHDNLLAVMQVLTRLRYNDPALLAIFGGRKIMIESPLIQELVDEAQARAKRESIVRFLGGRFGTVEKEVEVRLADITEKARLDDLVDWAARCPDLEAFRSRLPAASSTGDNPS
jgi:hypothetical protein